MAFAQSKEAGTDREMIKQYMNNRDTMPDLLQNKNVELVKKVLKRYNSAVEALKDSLLLILKFMNQEAVKVTMLTI